MLLGYGVLWVTIEAKGPSIQHWFPVEVLDPQSNEHQRLLLQAAGLDHYQRESFKYKQLFDLPIDFVDQMFARAKPDARGMHFELLAERVRCWVDDPKVDDPTQSSVITQLSNSSLRHYAFEEVFREVGGPFKLVFPAGCMTAVLRAVKMLRQKAGSVLSFKREEFESGMTHAAVWDYIEAGNGEVRYLARIFVEIKQLGVKLELVDARKITGQQPARQPELIENIQAESQLSRQGNRFNLASSTSQLNVEHYGKAYQPVYEASYQEKFKVFAGEGDQMSQKSVAYSSLSFGKPPILQNQFEADSQTFAPNLYTAGKDGQEGKPCAGQEGKEASRSMNSMPMLMRKKVDSTDVALQTVRTNGEVVQQTCSRIFGCLNNTENSII